MTTNETESVIATITPTEPLFLKSGQGDGYIALTLPKEQGGAASCWDTKLQDRLYEAATNGETITVTMERKGYNKRTGAPYQNITGIEGFAGVLPAESKAEWSMPKPDAPAKPAPAAKPAESGSRETTTKLDATDRYMRIANLNAISRMIASGALKPEGLNGALNTGEAYLSGGSGMKIVEGRLVMCDAGDGA